MNEVIESMENRQSIRAYKDTPVPKELIQQVIDAGLWAPSGMGRQSPVVVAVTQKELRDRLSKENARIMSGVMGKPVNSDPFYGAPVVLVFLAPKDVPTYVYDGSLVIGNMLNAAHALGLGACWIHRAKEEFEEPEFKKLLADLGIEGDYEGIGHCILGYPEKGPAAPKPRRDGRVYWVE